jgi:predicted nucleic acid-binding protein
MRILVDTCIWSEVLRRKKPNPVLMGRFKDLIDDTRVSIIGPIRQEVLSGISNVGQFNRLREVLSAFPDVPLRTEHFERAAEFCNICRGKGLQGSNIDFLICAVAAIEELSIYTTDKDFEGYSKHLPIELFA